MSPEVIARVMGHISPEPNTGCWLWAGAIGQGGYGVIGIGGTAFRAHRVVFELLSGPIPIGMHLCHRCDNPPCVNPDHLFPGTDADNSADKIAKGRAVYPSGDANGSRKHPECRPRGETHPRAKLTNELIRQIRIRAAAGESNLSIARSLHVASTTIDRIFTTPRWEHVK